MESSKKDWKLFREKIALWQESYMEKLVIEYTALLNDSVPASSKFWELEQRIKLDKKKPGVILNLSKQEMLFDIIRLINDGAITMDDLSDFSDELRNQVNEFYKKRMHD
ncbi:MAG: hypothetical protein IBX70_08645 [Clostridia bacterium]|nr:hypothetical protein [Clostridia bacterium]